MIEPAQEQTFIEKLVGIDPRKPLLRSLDRLRIWKVQADVSALQSYLAQLFGEGERPVPVLNDSLVYVAYARFQKAPKTAEDRPVPSAVVLWINVRDYDGTKQLCPVAFMDTTAALYAALLREEYGINVLLSSIREDDQDLVVKASILLEATNAVVQDEVLRIHCDTDPAPGRVLEQLRHAGSMVQLLQRRDAVTTDRAWVQSRVSATLELEANSAAGSPGRPGTLQITDSRVLRVASELGLTGERALLPVREDATVELLLSRLQVYAPIESAPPPNQLPKFRFACGDPQVPPPYAFRDVNIHGFRLEADQVRLQKVCDRYLNDPFESSLVRYEVASPSVIVELLEYGALTSLNQSPLPGMTQQDFETQHELSFRILVGKRTSEESQLRDARVFCPLIVVDSTWSVTTGREVIGFPKLLGEFIPVDSEPDFILVRATNGEEVIEIQPDSIRAVTPASGGWLWTDADLDGSLLDYEGFIMPWLTDNRRVYGMVQAKPATCIDRNVTPERLEGRYSIGNLRISLQEKTAELRLQPDLARELGVSPERQLVPADRWYHARCDFTLDIEDPLT